MIGSAALFAETIDFRYKGLPGFAFGRFYSAPGFGPDDTEIFYISGGRAYFYFSSSFSSTTNVNWFECMQCAPNRTYC